MLHLWGYGAMQFPMLVSSYLVTKHYLRRYKSLKWRTHEPSTQCYISFMYSKYYNRFSHYSWRPSFEKIYRNKTGFPFNWYSECPVVVYYWVIFMPSIHTTSKSNMYVYYSALNRFREHSLIVRRGISYLKRQLHKMWYINIKFHLDCDYITNWTLKF
jgi:hypothetical protein